MKTNIVVPLCLVWSNLFLGTCEVFSSASDMQAAFQIERDIIDILGKHANVLSEKLQSINDYLQGFGEVINERPLTDSNEDFLSRIAGNPIHAYKLVRRFVVDWKRIEDDLSKDEWLSETAFILRKKRLGAVMPREEDLHGAAKALIRLQEVYDLDMSDFTQGTFRLAGQTFETAAKLSAKDCLYLGKHSFNLNYYSQSLQWFEESWHAAGTEGNATLTQDQVKAFLDHAAKEHDELVLKKHSSQYLFPKPVFQESLADQRKKIHQDLSKKISEHVNRTTSSSALHFQFDLDTPIYNTLCQGIDIRPASYLAKLKCYLRDRGDAYFKLNPMKIEVLHLDPEILLYHEVTTEKERAKVKELAAPLLMRSQILGGHNAASSQVSTTRTSKTGWLKDSSHPVIKSLSERISWYTGLNTNAWTNDAELLQIANYVNAGHYFPHHDYVLKEKNPDHIILGKDDSAVGDRIATWMFYMSNVTAGGRTVFPRLGAATFPVEGGAVFWYNILDNGDADPRTLHGACPVLHGIKWVSNKWIREGGQTFTRPCKLTT